MYRGGRGAALRKLLEEQQLLETQPAQENEPVPTPPPHQQAERKGMGRGAMFAQHMAQGDISTSSTETSAPVASDVPAPVSKPGGRGRALLALVQAHQQSEVKPVGDLSPTSTTASASAAPSSDGAPSREREDSPTSSITSMMSEVTLSEKPPVVMKGSHGHPADMTCNYIRLNLEPGKGVFEYEVRFDPDVDSQKFRYDLLNQQKDVIGDVRSFDGTTLYLPFLLTDPVVNLVSKLPSDGSQVNVKVIFKKLKNLGKTIHLYNVLFRKIMNHLGYVLMGRHFFDPSAAKPVPAQRLEVWPGFITAVDEYEGGIMLCCDASHRVLRTETCLDLMEDLRQVMPHDWKHQFLDLVIGKTVLTRYNNKTYRIDDVLFDKTPMDTFPLKTGGEMSYYDYYNKHYSLQIKVKDQPLLVSKKTSRIKGQEMTQNVNLIPELSFITGLTDSMRADMKVMKDVAQHTRISPGQRHLALKKFIRNINTNQQALEILGRWGLKLEDGTVSLTGRIIPPEDILFARDKVEKGSLMADWSRASTSNHLLSAIDLNKWIIIYPSKEEKTIRAFADMLKKCSSQFGMRIDTPQFINIPDDRTESYLRMLRHQINDSVQLIVIILMAQRADKYAAVKKLCCIECPVPSQVVLTKTIRRPDKLRSISQKIALQMNCKVGGTLWSVKIPLKKIMVVGIDTYHDPSRKSASVSALVCSLNQPLTRWYSRTGRQEVGQELMDSITVNFIAALVKYNEVNSMLPEQVLIFRDGVGDGQLLHCKEYEIKQLQQACAVVHPSYMPKLLFVVVQKKINTRLFLNSGESLENPPPGSIMDHSICRRNWFDFFLVSQSVRQGTVSPTHYVVIHNSTSMSPDQIQRFSYKLAHLYYNYPGTIRVPAPCQYAHKLAYLVGESILKEANEHLQDKLFYL